MDEHLVSEAEADQLGYTLGSMEIGRCLTLDSDMSVVRQLLASGALPSVRVKRSGSPAYRIRPADLEEFIVANTTPAPLPEDAITPREASGMFGGAAALHNNAVGPGRVTVFLLLGRYRRYSRAEIERERDRWRADTEAIESLPLQITDLYAQGLSITKIAEKVGKSPATVHHHLNHQGDGCRSLSESISAARLALYAPKRARMSASAGACGSPGCADPTCEVKRGGCHLPGCTRPAAIAKSTDENRRRVTGHPTLYCSQSHAALARAMKCRGGAAVKDVLYAGGCGSTTCRDPACQVPYGRCHCLGCTNNAVIADHTDVAKRWQEGKPLMFCGPDCVTESNRLREKAIQAALRRMGQEPIRSAAALVNWSPDTLRRGGKLLVERLEVDGLVRLGINARLVLHASPDRHARRKLSRALAALNGTELIGRQRKLTAAEVKRVLELRGVGRSWRSIADELNKQRAPASLVSFMTVQRAGKRAAAPSGAV